MKETNWAISELKEIGDRLLDDIRSAPVAMERMVREVPLQLPCLGVDQTCPVKQLLFHRGVNSGTRFTQGKASGFWKHPAM